MRGGLEGLLAAHELAYGSPEFWRCACGFESVKTTGRSAINEHRAAAIEAHLLSDAVVDHVGRVMWSRRLMLDAGSNDSEARAILTAAIEADQ